MESARENIRDRIVAARRRRIAALGHTEGAAVPERREAPLAPFLPASRGPGVICEVKRQSPSKGDIAPGLDAAAQAGRYCAAGVGNISVLTEPTGFGGSLDDLMRVKREHPGAAVLRKDFLFDPEDVDVAYRAGADAVLLIAGMLSAERLDELHRRARALGIAALVEIHDREDVAKARAAGAELVGVNSRNLTDFSMDPLIPLRMKSLVDWPARVVYESGIQTPEQAAWAASCGFAGILVGEAAVRDGTLAAGLIAGMRAGRPARFWPALAAAIERNPERPRVKVCGLTRAEDARLAATLGADVLGFVFWEHSPRRAGAAAVRALADCPTLKVGVVSLPGGAERLPGEVSELLAEGLLDAVQFHGDETHDDAVRLYPTHFRALRPRDAAEAVRLRATAASEPRVLLDAGRTAPGGTGTRVPEEILTAWGRPLWLAGGLGPATVAEAVRRWRPELVDAASGLEAAPGVKSADKLREFFTSIQEGRHE